ncbi:SURF1 family protein [Cellulomonas sp. NPDC089187]|uniref:SURF1 family cytochrome oxidase biogenesis protein n=1 Tax=Cellulomonas sp. NPDC089187 TaxID=3154970 RepID=UPI003431CCC0
MTLSPATRRAIGLVLLAVTMATACAFLGRWQWNRHVNRDAAIRLVQTNYDADPVPLAELLPDTNSALDPARVWHPITVTGRYNVDGTVLLRNRPVNSQPGFHVLVPLVSDDGATLIIDRGWVAWDQDASGEVTVPEPPAGQVTVTSRLRPQEAASTRGAPAGQVQSINVVQVLAAGDDATADAYSAYGALVSENPAPTTSLGALPMPSTDPGSHLSYAFQWWTFGIGALIGFGWMARREIRDERGIPRGPGVALGDLLPQEDGTVRVPRRRRVSDEDTEDALIDAQLP